MAELKRLRIRRAAETRAVESEIQGFNTELTVFLNDEIEALLEGIETPEQAARVLGRLETDLDAAGLNSVYEGAVSIYANKLKTIGESFSDLAGVDIDFTSTDLDIAETLIGYDVSAMQSKAQVAIDDIRAQVFRRVLTGDTDFRPAIRNVTDALERNIQTELNTSVAGFERAVTLKKARDVGIKRFVYVGGLIKTSRDFCIERDGKIFTQTEINAWPDQHGLPANIYLGGYNCRHELVPVSDDLASRL